MYTVVTICAVADEKLSSRGVLCNSDRGMDTVNPAVATPVRSSRLVGPYAVERRLRVIREIMVVMKLYSVSTKAERYLRSRTHHPEGLGWSVSKVATATADPHLH